MEQKITGDRGRATGDERWAGGARLDGEQRTGDWERATGDERCAGGARLDGEQRTGDWERATGDERCGAGLDGGQRTGDWERATGDERRGARLDGEQRTGDRERATGDERWAGGARLDGERGLRRGSDIAERLLALAVACIRLASRLPKEPAARHAAAQLVRAATGGGANYEEARAAESRADFVHKVAVAAKEARETVFWLALIDRCAWAKVDLGPVRGEAMALVAILGASARTARANARTGFDPEVRRS
jgi:four helix bundle protein